MILDRCDDEWLDEDTDVHTQLQNVATDSSLELCTIDVMMNGLRMTEIDTHNRTTLQGTPPDSDSRSI